MPPALAAAQLDRYAIESLIGSGATGKVYRAFDTRLHRHVAFKLLEPGGATAHETVAAAVREARAAAAIEHPNVAAIFDADRLGDGAFIVMELVSGSALRRFVGDASVDVASRLRWLVDIAGALAAAHGCGVIHLDVKPENVLVNDDGVVKMLDFGVSRLHRHQPVSGAPPPIELQALPCGDGLVGTPGYMAPEQIRDVDLDGRADQFAWGVMAYELLAGELPWSRGAGPLGALSSILLDRPRPFPVGAGVPAEVVTAVMRALSKHRDDRFASMADVAAALAPFAAPSRGPLSLPPPSGPRTLPPASRDRERQPVSSAPGSPAPSSPPRAPAQAPPVLRAPAAGLTMASGLAFRGPDFARPIDLEAHLALLPPGATGKGMFFAELLSVGSRVRAPSELCRLAGIPEQRYLPFRDYPMSDFLELQLVVATAVHRGAPVGEGLRRLGRTALDVVLGSQLGRTVFGVLERDLEVLLLNAPKVHDLLLNFGSFAAEKVAAGRYLCHARGLPTFLETYHVGVIEGALRYCGVRGEIRIATQGLAEATFELTLT